VLTCTGVSFAHGSNDGQKGMGLIMLILVGTVPLAYALNRAMPAEDVTQFVAISHVAQESLLKGAPAMEEGKALTTLTEYIRSKHYVPAVNPALASEIGKISAQVKDYNSLAKIPTAAVPNVRNDMYLVSEAIQLLSKDSTVKLDPETLSYLDGFKKLTDKATKFIPVWVKIAVAIALGLGTMVGWKRIVVTVGEKIGKSHLTYGQGASAELVAMITIGAADMYGLPVSTTHVLSSGVAGTMAANKSGLQLQTIRNLAMAWIATLPAAMCLSGLLFWIFSHTF
ncbi:MAG TPA: anion permease, partial [Methylococcaceae bacterium]|nr:anion permease [Methylococcaceae bacterium]